MIVLTAFLAVCFAPMAPDSGEADFEIRKNIVYSKVADRE